MLDSETKHRIDTARNILVGKVPDPKSQVEQITIALIYKFMDDMDAESEEFGGTRKFFSGDFARYGWAKLMRSGLGGHEALGLYAEAIQKMPENPGIPLLFRDIFKNAYLPYRDPETLRAFLKIIDEFTYDHSERLGDAFEYLLSVLGSQGDAGQFRTPRHIIDFMVEVIAPQKHETVLDPACGTAGFLISSYKHIARTNVDAKGNSTLTPDDRARLAQNFKGYDISPDMVRLSLVNLYLHGFTDPHIFEYDSLTSEERWNEYADVILANPPFMSPKGGIKPHKRFSIQAKRSEVLFVDYMAEHLAPNGRAAIIVPEGIIFQSQTAYKALRKMLVEQSLVAVVSLPAGCFNPYSGVKTSILILDKALAKSADTVAFFKVENDGFGLGAQRRAIENSDLPKVHAELAEYLHALRSKTSITELKPACGQVIRKEQLATNGDYNLSGERYRAALAGQTRVPMIPLGKVAELIRGITFGKADQLDRATADSLLVATTKAAQSTGIVEADLYHVPRTALKDQSKLLRQGDILISTANSLHLLGRTTLVSKVERPMSFGAFMSLIRPNHVVIGDYLIRCLRTPHAADFFLRNANTTTNISNLNLSALATFEIPMPPLEVQKEIVAEIEGYQKVIDGARAVVDNYRPHIPVHADWPSVELGELCTIKSGGTPSRSNDAYWNGSIPWVTTTLIDYEEITHANEFITQEGLENSATWIVPKGTVLMAMYGQGVTRGRVAILGIDAAVNQACAVFQLKSHRLDSEYLFRALQSRYDDLRQISDARGGNQSNLSAQVLKEYAIPLPPIETQKAIVAEIGAEQALVNANRDLIARFEKKIQATLARVWGEAQ